MDIKLELIGVPVTDIDRAKEFYERVGFHTDHDIPVSEDVRFVQMTPPGSACSIAFGKGITEMAPGSLDNMQVVVASIEEAHGDLSARGIDVSPIDDQPWGSFVYFADPDGNRWAVQQTTPRGR
ncbi:MULTISPECIES: VOC family protein [Streptomyces]|uniref:Glyoxalase n=1 Tax=Streptomyces viridochromogenes TaxID=1938 RepID=A0A0L8LBL5_STRVR|nr:MULTISPECIES: VOC family protein [Streptomyces]KOG35532.1 glyoxalase [Streptomyces viridochromogenes]